MKTIEGFAIEVPAAELEAHLRDRAKWHDDQAAEFGNEIRARLGRDARPRTRPGEPIADDAALNDVRTARARAAELRYLADHLAMDASYRLDLTDLEHLELIEPVYSWRRIRRRVAD